MSGSRHGFVVCILGLGLSWLLGCEDSGNKPTTPTVADSTRTPPAEPIAPSTAESVSEVPAQPPTRDEVTPQTRAETSVAETSPATTPAPEATSAAATLKPLCEGWNKPAAVLVLSGEQHGYFEPCGCAEHQSGGVARRHDLVKQLQAKNWLLSSLDLGGTVDRSRPQSKLKFQTFLAAMKDMRYSVLNLGPEELKLGAADLLAFHQPNGKDPLSSLAFVSANVTLFGSPELGTPIRSKVLTFGPVKVGVTSIIGVSFRPELVPEGANLDLALDDPDAALPPVLKDLVSQKPDLLVLLSHGTLAEGKALAKKFPEFEVVLSAGGDEEPEFNNPQKIGKTLFVQVGRKGKFTGVLGFFPDDAQNRLRFELVKLTPERFKDSATMIEHMRLYQDLLKDSNLAETEPPIKHPSGSKFVGSKVCGECHTQAYDVWKESGHAHAYDSLIKGRPELKDRWVSRIHDPECLACHVTGWHAQDVLRYVGGFESKEKTPFLLDNGCENCHGPGSKHIQLIDAGEKEAARKEVRLTLEEAKKSQCYTCHDLDNSPKFKFDSYWEKIKHQGLD